MRTSHSSRVTRSGQTQQRRGRARGDDDGAAPRGERIAGASEIDQSLAERRQAARANQDTTLHERRSVCH
jgi:hypothetical protein